MFAIVNIILLAVVMCDKKATDNLFRRYSTGRSMRFSHFKGLLTDLKLNLCNSSCESHKAHIDLSLEEIFGLGLTSDEFAGNCSSILDILSMGHDDHHHHDHHHHHHKKAPDTKHAVLYGCLATLLVCLSSAPGMMIFRILPIRFREPAMAVLSSLSVGTLAGDALFHLIPQAYGLHSHDHSSDTSTESHLYKTLIVIVGMYSVYIMDILLSKLPGGDHASHHEHHNLSDHFESQHSEARTQTDRFVVKPEIHNSLWKRTGMFLGSIRNVKRYAYIVLFADSIHNASDGIALAASFSASVQLGLVNTLAVLLHELPHELGDYAILINAGFTNWQALFFNLLTAFTAYIGLGAGYWLTSYISSSLPWVLAYTAGVFLYVALVDLFPLLLPNKRTSNLQVTLFNVGLVTGFASMFLLAKYEDNIFPHEH